MFDYAAQRCSLSSKSVVSDVLQLLGDLDYGLTAYRNDTHKPIVTRLAAQAAIDASTSLKERSGKCMFFSMAVCK
jgi:hypothetical protein